MIFSKITVKRVVLVCSFICILVNLIAYVHAYKFTHFVDNQTIKTKQTDNFSTFDKLKLMVLGVNNPQPKNNNWPSQAFRIIRLKSNRSIECWSIKAKKSKGTVILFHGYGGQKSSMLDKSNEFLKLGYSTFLVDFMGSGNSEGNQTTIGFLEAAQVKTCFDYLNQKEESNIYLFGTSMGAVAILKAVKDYGIIPTAIIVECPFGSMYETVCARFKILKVPTFPMAGLLVFWGGVQNGYWAFSHNPEEYARNIKCPVLLLYGGRDEKVSRKEIDAIFFNLSGKKQLKIYQEAGHENYLLKYKQQWISDVQNFLEKVE